MTNEALVETVKRTLLAGLQRHSKSLYGSVVDVPHIAARGDYQKVSGWFGLDDVAQDIATAVATVQEAPKS